MIQAYFNQIRKKIIEEINNSNKDIIIAVAWFTQHDLFDAIINALERGVNISLILRGRVLMQKSAKGLENQAENQ